jgi:hypothetical protein
MSDAAPRQTFIPVLKRTLVDALGSRAAQMGQDGAKLQSVCQLMAAILHHQYFAELEVLRDSYRQFAPGKPAHGHAISETPLTAFIQTFESVLRQASFEEIPPEELGACDSDDNSKPVRTRAHKSACESIRFFRRGGHTEELAHKNMLGFAGKAETLEVYDDVILLVRFKTAHSGRSQPKLPQGASPGSVMIKSFINIPRRDICMLFPEVRILMTRTDALLLGGPALAGAIPILLNIVPALSVMLVLAGTLLGYKGAVSQDQLTQAVGALAALAGAGAFVFRQYSNYAHKRLKYQKKIADSIYFRNLTNNAGVFESLISAAEEQDVKEAILAYAFLLDAQPKTKEDLDSEIEAWLRAGFHQNIGFEIGDALAKLEHFGLVERSGPLLSAIPAAEALIRLDALWDGLYDYNRAARA